MPVYIRGDAKQGVYSYEFRLHGRRFSGSTGCTARREAEAVERARREEAALLIAAEKALQGPRLTLEQACARHWLEVGSRRRDATTRLACLDWLLDYFGKSKPIATIGNAEVASMVAKRRGEKKWGRKDKGFVAPATVNRTATEPLRDVLTRARKVWKAETADVEWKLHWLEEPQERVREASAAEEEALRAAVPEGYRDVLDATMIAGCRRCELVGDRWALRWEKVDFINRRFEVTGKGGRRRFIPMSAALFDLFRRLLGNHPEFVFTYVATRTRTIRSKDDVGNWVTEKIERGKRYPVTESGMKSVARRKLPASGVTDFRFHDTRHTAGSRITRAAGIRTAQQLLGHADIETTTKYAHVQDDDIRRAMEAASVRATPDEMAEALALVRKRKTGEEQA